MSKLTPVLALALFGAAFAGPTDKLLSVLNAQGKTANVVTLTAGIGFPEVLTRPESFSLQDGMLTYVQKKDEKNNKVEITRCFPNVPIQIVILESAKDGKKAITVTTVSEVTAGAPCSKTLEGVAKSQLAAANNLVTFSVGGVTVFPKASFKIDFADGVITVEGKNTAGDKVTILSVASLTSVRLDVDGAKDLKNVIFAGSLNTPVIAKKGLF
ncbi:MAG: hypothetical protein J0L75_16720 [Spirochaetes bacterium]|nr:hypothetical protein [Spirochaetota bacterium]